jgi:hypothetical protein
MIDRRRIREAIHRQAVARLLEQIPLSEGRGRDLIITTEFPPAGVALAEAVDAADVEEVRKALRIRQLIGK